jgi:predicted transcriptional regulator
MTTDLVIAQIQTKVLSPQALRQALQQIYANLMTLQAQEETDGTGFVQTIPELVNWRESITRQTITCLECGAAYKQLSIRHLRQHDLNGQSYRAKYRIPRSQPLAARSVTAIRRKIVQETRPWEKAPAFVKAHGVKKAGRKKAGQARTA